MTNINVNINQGTTIGKALFGVLVLIALILAYWQAVLTVVGVLAAAALIWFAWRAWQQTVDAQGRENAALAARADAQHEQVLRGDPAGTYGMEFRDGEDLGR